MYKRADEQRGRVARTSHASNRSPESIAAARPGEIEKRVHGGRCAVAGQREEHVLERLAGELGTLGDDLVDACRTPRTRPAHARAASCTAPRRD